jgi:hypothetical protein
MTDPGLLRFLELVVRDLGAVDARVELGGKDPEDPRLVFRPAPSGGRVVVIFDVAPTDRKAVEARLDALIGPLFGAAEHAVSSVPAPRLSPDIAGRRLDDELGQLAERAGARGAVVFDLASPVVWGASRTGPPGAEQLLEDTIVKLRESQSELHPGHTARLRVSSASECLARPFAGVYVVALAFESLASELVALGALLHAMPLIERLVLALPPVDPTPGGKLMRMPVRLR